MGAVQPHLEPGDLVIWNSTTLHCNVLGSQYADSSERIDTRRHGNWSSESLGRVAALLTMTPATKASAEVLQQRKLAVCAGLTTTHWPHRFMDAEEHNHENWMAMGDEYKQHFRFPQPPALSAAELRLVGYSESELLQLKLDSQGRLQ